MRRLSFVVTGFQPISIIIPYSSQCKETLPGSRSSGILLLVFPARPSCAADAFRTSIWQSQFGIARLASRAPVRPFEARPQESKTN